jgi:tRNA-2-methylthio-N6-dimethylallyladenosine synthase
MNEYDSNRIYDLTASIGFQKTDIKKKADCFVINTCHIREKATEKVYHEIGRVKKEFRNLKKPLVIVSGCVAQAESDEMIKREPYIDIIIGPQSYHKISDLILSYQRKKERFNETEFDVVRKFDELEKVSNSQNKISANLTIQEGCDKFCHFCVVPYTRGPEYSRPFIQIISEAKKLIDNGAKEIILLGQNVNAYNFSDNKKNYRLSDLIRKLDKINGLERIRFTTSHPKDMTEDLIKCYGECEKLMPFLHLPIQSGSDKILKAMNRKHNKKYYFEIVDKLKKINEKINFSSDFIVGYPGETEKDFKETIDLVNEVGFLNSYSFIFSPRPGTPIDIKETKNSDQSKEKLKKLQSVLEKHQLKSNQSFIHKDCKVLIENKSKNKNSFFGRTKFMTPVKVESDNCKIGQEIDVKITSSNKNSLFGFYNSNEEKAA